MRIVIIPPELGFPQPTGGGAGAGGPQRPGLGQEDAAPTARLCATPRSSSSVPPAGPARGRVTRAPRAPQHRAAAAGKEIWADRWLSVFELVGLHPARRLLMSPCHKCIVMQRSSFSY
jgi:hypothetical protein